MVALEQFLVLPGVYDMALLDRLMDAAADRGLPLKIRFGVHYEPGKEEGFTYLRYSRQANVDGTPDPAAHLWRGLLADRSGVHRRLDGRLQGGT